MSKRVISCSCSTRCSTMKEKHEVSCNFLSNELEGVCCDLQLCGSTKHNTWCKNAVSEGKPKRAMWVRLLVYEGTEEWVNACASKAIRHGVTLYGAPNTITATTVCWRDDL